MPPSGVEPNAPGAQARAVTDQLAHLLCPLGFGSPPGRGGGGTWEQCPAHTAAQLTPLAFGRATYRKHFFFSLLKLLLRREGAGFCTELSRGVSFDGGTSLRCFICNNGETFGDIH